MWETGRVAGGLYGFGPEVQLEVIILLVVLTCERPVFYSSGSLLQTFYMVFVFF